MNDTLRILLRSGIGLGLILSLMSSLSFADPCGMVPPIDSGSQNIARVGVQQTYVFYRDGLETFVIRPGFKGNMEHFGMLIPFPNPPAIRKVPMNVFEQIAAAIDPPEVEIDFRPGFGFGFGGLGGFGGGGGGAFFGGAPGMDLEKDEVKVLKEEAVGMYEVAVLAAGSSKALSQWMSDHEYKYPEGMDEVCNEYIEMKWCFVAVKTKIAGKKSVDPKPGMKKVKATLPVDSIYNGSVQAMGFRFHSDELVVPMRLSTFNEGELRNIVYVLTDEPAAIRGLSSGMVKRQLSGLELLKNITSPLPLRVYGKSRSKAEFLSRVKDIKNQRNPEPANGVARDLFASDLKSLKSGELDLNFELKEKKMLAINERFNLRGEEIEPLILKTLRKERINQIAPALLELQEMTMTVIDGDFPKEFLSKNNLHFREFTMKQSLNTSRRYHSVEQGPVKEKGGRLLSQSEIDFQKNWQQYVMNDQEENSGQKVASSKFPQWPMVFMTMMIAVVTIVVGRRICQEHSDATQK